jgi:hypothetical protein
VCDAFKSPKIFSDWDAIYTRLTSTGQMHINHLLLGVGVAKESITNPWIVIVRGHVAVFVTAWAGQEIRHSGFRM